MELIGATIAWLTDPANWQGPDGIPTRVLAHILVSGTALLFALLIGLPIGLIVGHTRKGAAVAINVANIGRALPTLAVITLVLPVTVLIDNQLGFKVYPTLIALVILGLPPIIVNTYTGISSVDPDLIEAARGMGLTERRVLSRVEIPVAIPVISGGVRAAATQIVATATLGAIFGGIGLGRFLVEGIAQNDDGMIFGGVTLVALLCIATEGLFTWIQRRLTSPGLAPAAVWMSRLQDVPAAARV
jgi:osmoprotectant transport system permease protein